MGLHAINVEAGLLDPLARHKRITGAHRVTTTAAMGMAVGSLFRRSTLHCCMIGPQEGTGGQGGQSFYDSLYQVA